MSYAVTLFVVVARMKRRSVVEEGQKGYREGENGISFIQRIPSIDRSIVLKLCAGDMLGKTSAKANSPVAFRACICVADILDL